MGRMIDGDYVAENEPLPTDASGRWTREDSVLRDWITRDGSPGPGSRGGYPAEPGRYHLYVAINCPWAHRARLAVRLLGLEDVIDESVAAPRRTEAGWVFEPEGRYADRLFGTRALHEIYARGAEAYSGRVTVPVLWDRKTGRIVSNESADIVRMLNQAFDGAMDLCPEALREEIDAWNARIYRTVNNGVYRAGFATSQDAYEEAAREVFETLDAVEARLGESRWLAGERFTEADLRLFPTLARLDVAYHYAFRCNLRRLTDYPRLWAFAREIYQMDGVAGTVDFEIYKRGYHSISEKRNPFGIVPIGPELPDWDAPHGRG